MTSVRDYVDGYEWRRDDGSSLTPTEWMRAMIEDAVEGYLSEAGVVAAPRSLLSEAREAMRACGWQLAHEHDEDEQSFGARLTRIEDDLSVLLGVES